MGLPTNLSHPAAQHGRRQVPLSGMCQPARSLHTGGEQEQQVLEQLKNVIDPDLHQDIVSLGFVQNLTIREGVVSFDLVLTTPACPVKDKFKKDCTDLIKQLPWVKDVKLTLSSQHRPAGGGQKVENSQTGLKDVKRIIAVSSAKGGVGKSTVAVNLAFSIAKLGGKVGIFDADIYGPSLPTMVGVENPRVVRSQTNEERIAPLHYQDVKLMSYGFTAKARGGQASIMRGPMVASTVHQLLAFTDWGELDYLVLDFPPGTGDIQLTICQQVNIDGAVIVTTPQKLSFVDVVRGIEMFDTLNVPIVALVENMSYFDCSCGTRHFPFGEGHSQKISDQYGTPSAVVLPIHSSLSASSDSGTPFAMRGDEEKDATPTALREGFEMLASNVVQELSRLGAGGFEAPIVEFEETSRKFIVRPLQGEVVEWTCEQLRERCQAAKSPPPCTKSTGPKAITPKGRYAVEIQWNDQHVSIFPYKVLKAGPQ